MFNSKTLIVAPSVNGELDTVNPATGTSTTIAGVSVPLADAIVLEDRRLWAVQNFTHQVSRIRLRRHLTSECRQGHHQRPVPDPGHRGPQWPSPGGDHANFDTGFPPTADRY